MAKADTVTTQHNPLLSKYEYYQNEMPSAKFDCP